MRTATAGVRIERAQDPPDGAAAINHVVAGRPANGLQQVVQQRIVQRPGEHGHGPERESVNESVDFPESEMPGEKQHALSMRVGGAQPVVAFELHAAHHSRRRHRAEFEERHQQPAEVLEHVPRDGTPLDIGACREGTLQVPQGEPAMRTIDDVKCQTQQAAGAEDDTHRQHTDDRHHRHDGGVLEAMTEGRTLISQR